MTNRFKVEIKINEKNIQRAAEKVLWKTVNKVAEISKIICPVDTGRLRASIHITPARPGEIKYLISDGVEYGVHIEYGTSKMDAQPFFRPAMDQTIAFWVPRFWNEVSKMPEFQ